MSREGRLSLGGMREAGEQVLCEGGAPGEVPRGRRNPVLEGRAAEQGGSRRTGEEARARPGQVGQEKKELKHPSTCRKAPHLQAHPRLFMS